MDMSVNFQANPILVLLHLFESSLIQNVRTESLGRTTIEISPPLRAQLIYSLTNQPTHATTVCGIFVWEEHHTWSVHCTTDFYSVHAVNSNLRV